MTSFPIAAEDLPPVQSEGLTPDQSIWYAMSLEDRNWLQRLVTNGANLNTIEPLSGMTPLMAAETYELALILVQGGANVASRDVYGRTPLHYAVQMRDAERIIPLFIGRGADANAQAEDGLRTTPLLAVIEHSFDDPDKKHAIKIIRLLVSLGAQPDMKSHDGQTALSIAATRGDASLVSALIELGADPAARVTGGETLLDRARKRGEPDIVAVLSRALASKRRAQ
ncbi:MAG: ankyrin repeat domain-containing protein [Hyphomicrobiales bacterium]|nr:ankyrin repeat domain-containing protein [Hyphomicrobiales bacterium]